MKALFIRVLLKSSAPHGTTPHSRQVVERQRCGNPLLRGTYYHLTTSITSVATGRTCIHYVLPPGQPQTAEDEGTYYHLTSSSASVATGRTSIHYVLPPGQPLTAEDEGLTPGPWLMLGDLTR